MSANDASDTDQLILVDLLDRPCGAMEKLACHQQGLLHRAFSVFLYRKSLDGSYELLLQKRALSKYHSGGLWTNSCCSHPRVGEQTGMAVTRRLEDELGVRGVACTEIGSFVYRHEFDNGLCEFEYDHVFVGEYDGPIVPNPHEASAVAWVDVKKALGDLQTQPERFTCWFMTAAPMVARWLLVQGHLPPV